MKNQSGILKTVKTNLELYRGAMGGYRWLQVVIGDYQEEVIIFRDKHTDRHFIIIYIYRRLHHQHHHPQHGWVTNIKKTQDIYKKTKKQIQKTDKHEKIISIAIPSMAGRWASKWRMPGDGGCALTMAEEMLRIVIVVFLISLAGIFFIHIFTNN